MKKIDLTYLSCFRVLRTFTLLIAFTLFTGALRAAEKYSPNFTLDIKDKSVKDVFTEIEKKSEFVFFYFDDDIDPTRIVSVNVQERKIGDVLDQIFRGTDIDYSVKDKQIYISKKKDGAAKPDDTAPKRVVGQITDAKGEPLIGVTVTVKNSTTTTTTNTDGVYVIDAGGKDFLTFTHGGFRQMELPVAGTSIQNVVLQEDELKLEDVVMVGYGRQKKASVVGSVSTIGTKELAAPTGNLTNNLAGQLAGLISIQRSAEPGRDDAEFWIRGISTFQGGTTPLVLVDGIPRAMSNIEPDEIDTFTLLKDAAATAVYGAEGANGVILITTKRGMISKPKISFRGEYSLSTPTRLPEFVDSWDYLELANEANFNDGMGEYIAQSEIEKYRSRIDNDLYPNSKWLNELLSKTTTNQRYTLSFRGGAENAKYFVSLAYFQQDGVFKDNPMQKYKGNLGLERYNLRSNVDLKLTKTTSLNIDIAGQYVNKQSPIRSVDDIFLYMLYTPPHLFPAVYSDGTLGTYARETDPNNRNPYNMLMNEGYKREWGTKIQSNIGLSQDLNFITLGMSFLGKLSLDYDGNFATSRTYNPTTYHATGRDADDNLIFIVPHSGSPVLQDPSTSYGSIRKIYIEGSLNYQRIFGRRHNVGGMLLYMQKETQQSGTALPYRKQGLVGRVTYSYDNRYFIEGNFGYTGSETFAQGHRFGLFPAVGLGYLISNENFYPDALARVMGKAKLRFSYGRTGNDDAGGSRFLYRATFNTAGGYFDQGYTESGSMTHLGAQGVYDARFANDFIRWEIEKKMNVGLDLGFFNNRIDITVDYFKNRRESILLERNTVPGVAGLHARPWQNYGIVDNWGFDGNITARHKFGQVNVSLRGTFTFARNKIVEFDELPQMYTWMDQTGQRIGSQRLYIAERLYTEEDFIRTQKANGTYTYKLKPGLPVPSMDGLDTNYLGPGDIKYKDLNNDGRIDLYDMTRNVGYPYNPEINYGFGINVEYKGFYLSAFLQGTGNTSILIATGNDTFFPFNWGLEKSNYRTAFLENRWTAENPRQDVLMPRLHTGYQTNNNIQSSTWWLRDGSFLRLKNMEFGYNMPREFIRKLKMEAARVYVLGYNLYVWDKVKYWDPEQGNRNKGNSYPMVRTFTLGLEVNF